MQTQPAPAARPSEKEIRRVVLSSFLGTSLEWYDFFLFGTTAAIVFAPLFFPSENTTAATLGAFAAFAVGFIARPFGAVLFGHLGDRLGRKGTLIATLILMGVATTLMGVLPDYHTAGVIAPVLLTILRFAQGIATGGEWGGATLMALEFAPPEKKGMYASIVQMGSPVGNILSTGAVTLFVSLAGAGFLAWGWRVPYLLSIVLILFALWMRSGIKESPEFQRLLAEKEVERMPVLELIAKAWPRVLVAAGAYFFGIAGFFMMTTFGISYIRNIVKIDPQIALNAIIIGAVSQLFTLWLAGRMSIKIGPARATIVGYSLAVVAGAPFFFLLDTANFVVISVAYVLGLGIASIPYGPVGAVMNKLFPAKYNYSGLAVAANLAGLVSGFMPWVATWVMSVTNESVWGPTFLIFGIAIISLVSTIIAHRMITGDEAGQRIGIRD